MSEDIACQSKESEDATSVNIKLFATSKIYLHNHIRNAIQHRYMCIKVLLL